MPRPVIPKRATVAKVGNYAAEIDTTGMSDENKAFFTGTKLTKLERDYVKGTGRKSALEAVKRARKANKQPLLKED